ncbi:MAG: alpha-1,2-fucosyltransferase [Cytophagales bacterium]|nr:alpha-1,2-fucosyltransferase [Cytophagales bacterium]
MIVVKLIGGLGNQMFQYAIGRHLAIINQQPLLLDISAYKACSDRYYALDCFNIRATIAHKINAEQFRQNGQFLTFVEKIKYQFFPSLRKRLIKEPHFHYSPDIIKSYEYSIYLEGYWQSEKYFLPIREQLLQDFTLAQPLSEPNRLLAEHIGSVESVSIHVRRGDYVSNPIANACHGTCESSYYQQAIEKIASMVSNPFFFVFSDEPQWFAENVDMHYPYVVVAHNQGRQSYNDLHLMRLCKHNIIANSSFSWWGAWLNTNPKKVVIAPRQWFNPNSKWFKEWDLATATADLVPPEWIRI